MNNLIKNNSHHSKRRYLAVCISAIISYTGGMSTSVDASDIEIYKSASAGSTTLMFMLDISGSMGSTKVTSSSTVTGYSYYEDYGLLDCGLDSQTDTPPAFSNPVNNKVYSVNSTTNPIYQRNFCYLTQAGAVTKPLVKKNCEEVSNGYRCYDRLTKLKDGLFDLLLGNSSKGIQALSDDKVIGLSAFSYRGAGRAGYVLVPAKSLDTVINGLTQRIVLLNNIASLSAYGGTPTANAYVDTAAYLMGTTTFDFSETFKQFYFQMDKLVVNKTYLATGINHYEYGFKADCDINAVTPWDSSGNCISWLSWWPANGESYYDGFDKRSGQWKFSTNEIMNGSYYYNQKYNSFSGFSLSTVTSKDSANYLQPNSLTNKDNQCKGQGIYVLTDGAPNGSSNDIAKTLMERSLTTKASSFNCNSSSLSYVDATSAWECIGNFTKSLLDSNKNPAGLKFKTAVVGFGTGFNGISSYDKKLTPEQNLTRINNSSASLHQKNAARWGVIGQGGWYSGSNSQDIVDSVNSFLGELGGEVKPLTTGKVTIANDPLNPTKLENVSYYPHFQPKPNDDYQLWLGNLKKYNLNSIGSLDSARDLWALSSVSSQDQGPSSLLGGVVDKLALGYRSDSTANRILYSNRDITKSSDNYNGNRLVKLSLSDLIDSNNQDPSRGYFVSLLGFDVDATHPENINKTTLQQASELRQIGAVMHSSPLLITNYAKVKDSVYSNRQNYVVFGTTQGLLHVVDADSGVEKLAFVPNEMVENQKLAFVRPELSSGGVSHLFYGVDAPWVADTEYVLAPNDAVTVGKGLYEQEGRQVLYGGLRMGGKSYYALDLSDIDAPKLKFQIIPKGSCSSSNLIGCMGQSWSKPTIAWVNWKGYKKRVMFVGGGYDAEGNGTDASKNATDKYKGYEYEDYQQRSKIGAGVYMFDAETGELLWTASANVASNLSSFHEDLKYSVVSQIKTVDRNADGLVDHLYFGDLGGQVWRIDLNNTAGKNNANLFSKKPVRLLNLNKSANSPRFYEAPAFSTYSENGKIVAVISIGSGNRSKPLADYASDSSYLDDAIYNIYDKDVVRSDLFDVVDNNYKNQNDQLLSHDISIRGLNDSNAYLYLLDDNNRFSKNSVYSTFENNAGWYYPFKKSRIQTEKVTDSPIVMNYRMYVNTFDASASGTTDQCGAGVAGGSFMTLFCMPFGQCGSGAASDYRLSLGSGMVGGSVGPLAEDALSRSLVTNTDISTKNSIWTDSPKTALKVRVLRWYERTQ